MSNNDTDTTDAPTRRDTIKYGGTVVSGGLLAGCAGDRGSSSIPTDAGTDTIEDENYSVTLSPMGPTEFDSTPQTKVTTDAMWVDHLIALGQQEGILAMGDPPAFYTGFYDELPGVDFDKTGIKQLYGESAVLLDKELLYELDADVHHLDPLTWINNGAFEKEDIADVRENIAPFFANFYSLYHNYSGDQEYQYYSLWELSSKFAQVYKVRSRSSALRQVRDEMVSRIQNELPPEKERPRVGLVGYWDSVFKPAELNGPGFGKAMYRPLGARDAFADSPDVNAGGDYSAEAILEVNPDVMINPFRWLFDYGQFDEFKSLDDEPVASKIAAVKNNRVYGGGSPHQGPLMNLFQIELAAKQIYPRLFGNPPAPRESVPEEERLFDRQRVADIVNGEF